MIVRLRTSPGRVLPVPKGGAEQGQIGRLYRNPKMQSLRGTYRR